MTIARMLGKTVRVRRCPATVSAKPASPSYTERQEASRARSADGGEVPMNHWRQARAARLWEGGCQKARVRRPVFGAHNPLAFRGERRTYR